MSLRDFDDMASDSWRAGLGLVTSPFMARAAVPAAAQVDDEEPPIQYPLSSRGQYLHHRHSDWRQVRQIENLRQRQHKSTLSDIWDPPIAPGLGLYTSPNNSTPRTYGWASSGLASGPPSSVAGSATGNVAPRARHENGSTSHHQAPRLEVDTKPRLDQQQRQLQEVEQQMIVLRSEKEQLDERIATLKETEQHIKDNIVDLNIEGIQTRKKRKEAEAKLGPAQEDLARVVEQLEGARAELLLKGAELTALKDTLAEQQKEAASVQERVTELQQTLSRTQDALILHGDQLKDIRRCCDDAQRELAELQTAKQSATAALENEQRNLLSVEETLRKEKSSASDAQTQLATLRQELSRLRTEVDTVKISRERDGNKVKTALEQENNAKAALVALEAQIKDRQRERDAQATRHATEVQKAKDELQAITTSRDAINGQLEKAKARINNATKAMEEAERKQQDAEARATKAEVDLSKRIADAEKRATAADAAAARAEVTATKTDERARKAEEDLQQVIRSREEAILALQQLEAALKLAASKRLPEAVTASQSETADPGLSSTPSAEDNSEHGCDIETPSQESESAYETASNSSQTTTRKWDPVATSGFRSSRFHPGQQPSTSSTPQPPSMPAPPHSASVQLRTPAPATSSALAIEQDAVEATAMAPLSPPASPVTEKISLPAKRAHPVHTSTDVSAFTLPESAQLQPLNTTVIPPPQITQEPTPPMTAGPSVPGIMTPAPSTSSDGHPTSNIKDKAPVIDAPVPPTFVPSSSSTSGQGFSGLNDVSESWFQQNLDDSSTASSTVQHGPTSGMDIKASSVAPSPSGHATPTIAQQDLSAPPNLNAGAGAFVPRGMNVHNSPSATVHGGSPGISGPAASKSGKESSPSHRSTENLLPQSPTNAREAPTHRLITSSAPLNPKLNSESHTGLSHMNQLHQPQSPQSPKNSRTPSTKKSDPTPSLAMPKEKEAKARGFGNWGPAALMNMATRAINTAADILGPTIAEDEGPVIPTTPLVRNSSDLSRASPHNAVWRSPELAPSSDVRSPLTQTTTPQKSPPDGAELQKTTGLTSGSSEPPGSRRKQDHDTAIPMVSGSPLSSKKASQEQHVATKEQTPDVQVEVASLVDTSDNSTPQYVSQESTEKVIVAPSIPTTVSSSHTETEPGFLTDMSSPPLANENPVQPIPPIESLSKVSTKEDLLFATPVEFAEPTATPLAASPATEQPQEKGQEQPHVQQPLPSVPAQSNVKPDEQLPAKNELPLAPSASGSTGAAAVPIAETTPAETTPETTTPPPTTSVFSKRVDDLVIQVKPGANPFPVAIFEVIFPTEYTIPTFDDEGFGSGEDDASGAAGTPRARPHRQLSELS